MFCISAAAPGFKQGLNCSSDILQLAPRMRCWMVTSGWSFLLQKAKIFRCNKWLWMPHLPGLQLEIAQSGSKIQRTGISNWLPRDIGHFEYLVQGLHYYQCDIKYMHLMSRALDDWHSCFAQKVGFSTTRCSHLLVTTLKPLRAALRHPLLGVICFGLAGSHVRGLVLPQPLPHLFTTLFPEVRWNVGALLPGTVSVLNVLLTEEGEGPTENWLSFWHANHKCLWPNITDSGIN